MSRGMSFTLLGFFAGSIVFAVYGGCREAKKRENVQEGFVAPAEIGKCRQEDIDNSGAYETVLPIKGADYLLKWDDKRKPILVPYRVEVKVVEERREREGALTGKVEEQR